MLAAGSTSVSSASGTAAAISRAVRALATSLERSRAILSVSTTPAQQAATGFNQAVRGNMDALQALAETIEKGQPLVEGWVIGQRLMTACP